MSHTPGPFVVEQVVSDGPFDICLGYERPGEGSPILIASTHEGPMTRKEAHDNAILFSAAPDLLAALKLAEEAMCQATFHLKGRNCGDLNAAIKKCREAIAKTKGKQ